MKNYTGKERFEFQASPGAPGESFLFSFSCVGASNPPPPLISAVIFTIFVRNTQAARTIAEARAMRTHAAANFRWDEQCRSSAPLSEPLSLCIIFAQACRNVCALAGWVGKYIYLRKYMPGVTTCGANY